MTTIALRDGVLAADTLLTSNGTRVGHCQKLRRVAGWMLAGCGAHGGLGPIIEWVEQGAKLNKPVKWNDVDCAGALLVGPDGQVFHVCTDTIYVATLYAPFHAEGSGTDFALAAMACGQSARGAIDVASRFDLFTGGRVNWMTADAEDLRLPD